MASSRAVQLKSERLKALRMVRRVYRTLDSKGEAFERRIDRLIARKTMVELDEVDPLIKDYYAIKSQLAVLEKAMVDASGIIGY